MTVCLLNQNKQRRMLWIRRLQTAVIMQRCRSTKSQQWEISCHNVTTQFVNSFNTSKTLEMVHDLHIVLGQFFAVNLHLGFACSCWWMLLENVSKCLQNNNNSNNSVREYVFYVFSHFKKHDFLRFFEMTHQKVVKIISISFIPSKWVHKLRSVIFL